MKIYKPIVDRIEQDGTQVLSQELLFDGDRVIITTEAGEYLQVVETKGEVVFWRIDAKPAPPELELIDGGKSDASDE